MISDNEADRVISLLKELQDLKGFLGIPVKCSLCRATGVEWYNFSRVEIRQVGRKPVRRADFKTDMPELHRAMKFDQ